MNLTIEHIDALRQFQQQNMRQPYSIFPKGPARDALRRAGFIERWNPILKCTGKNKPWRVTDAGRLALQSQGGDAP
jgi:hypothetical protein